MAQALTDILIKQAQENEKYFRRYLWYAQQIKKEAENQLGKVKVFIFGSILKKGEVPRDIDILVVSAKLSDPYQKREMKVKIWEEIGIFSPFEIHLATPEEFSWYQRFIDKKIEI